MINVDDEMDQQQEARDLIDQSAHGKQLRALIDRGFAVQQFMDGELGKWLKAEASAQRAEHVEQLVTLDPDDPAARITIRELRMVIAALDLWQMFFAGFIQEGQNAQSLYAALDHPD